MFVVPDSNFGWFDYVYVFKRHIFGPNLFAIDINSSNFKTSAARHKLVCLAIMILNRRFIAKELEELILSFSDIFVTSMGPKENKNL